MKDLPELKGPTPALKSAVNAYLMAKVYAECKREEVDAVYHDILTECPVYTTAHHGREGGKQITDHNDLYMGMDKDADGNWFDPPEIEDAYDEADQRLKKLGIKPQDMERDYCPALVAESTQRETEWLIIECGAEMLGVDDPKGFNNKLLCGRKDQGGMETRQEFIDLCVGLVVNFPGFCNPLTGRGMNRGQ